MAELQPKTWQPSSNRTTTTDSLSESQLWAVAKRYGTPGLREGALRFRQGTDIIVQGDHGPHDNRLYILLEGELDILRVDTSGNKSAPLTRIEGTGAVVGEIRALNPSVRRTRTVEAATDVHLIAISRESVASWNGAKAPWGRIYDFVLDLARLRYDSLSEEDREIAGIDEWEVPIIAPLVPKAKTVVRRLKADIPPQPLSQVDAELKRKSPLTFRMRQRGTLSEGSAMDLMDQILRGK